MIFIKPNDKTKQYGNLTNPVYLKSIHRKFGVFAVRDIKQMTKIKVVRNE